MLSVAGVVAIAEVEWLGSIRGPLSLVVEWCGIPDNLIHELWDPDGMGRWAAAAETEEGGWAGGWVGDVALVVWAVEIYTIPATRETVSAATS